jgi:hypothetical protein
MEFIEEILGATTIEGNGVAVVRSNSGQHRRLKPTTDFAR